MHKKYIENVMTEEVISNDYEISEFFNKVFGNIVPNENF